jgi:cell division protein FtsW
MKRIAQYHNPDFILLAAVLALVVFGLLMVYNASPVTSLRDYNDPLHLVKLQAVWAGFGIFLGIVVYKIPFTFWKKISPFLILFAIALLSAVFIPGLGVKVYGAQRWLSLGVIGVQPAEFAKLAYILYLAALLSKKVKLSYFLGVSFVLVAIVLAQKDLGTSIIIILIGLTIYFVSGAAWRHVLVLIPIIMAAASFFIFVSEYRRARLLAFLNPSVDPQGISYHVYQALIAIGSGGFFGVGLGQSRQKYGFIPEVTTDSIFTVVGNELGFLGSLVLVSIFLVVVYRGFNIAKNSTDKFAQLVAIGLTVWIGLQTFINLAGLVALLPLTGVPLPFISYGGSSLVATLIATAILLNISRVTSNNVALKK